ncbi:MAG: hypothetical protein HYX48_05765 [Chlamydiales bacterium]|nr:hypothetical protein [Chlamydiales bacterium]
MRYKVWIKILCFCLVFRGVERFCHQKTEGFKVSNVISDLSYDPRREVSPLAESEMREVSEILSQPFTFLGSGGQAYAFLSADGKSVLKLFKYHHLSTFPYLKRGPFSSFAKQREEKRERFFESCRISFEEMREETGLLYLQLNKSTHWNRKITLIDKLGIAHTLELDQLEFALQKRASLALSSLKSLVKKGKREEAKQTISSMISLLAARCQKGVGDSDSGLRRNMGLLDTHAISIDIGSFSKNPDLLLRANMEKEVKEKSLRLARWLKKSDPELSNYYDETVQKITQ